MPEIMSRYKYLRLGHSEPMIQQSLDKLGSERILSVIAIGVNVFAIVEITTGTILNPIKKVK